MTLRSIIIIVNSSSTFIYNPNIDKIDSCEDQGSKIHNRVQKEIGKHSRC